jgi:hypothetical protein
LISTYLELKETTTDWPNANPLREAPLDSSFFNDAIAAQSCITAGNPLRSFRFEKGICHRCNMKTPSLRYCHEMYGGEFVQHYGWFINQNYLRLGILRRGSRTPYHYVPGTCPRELQELIHAIRHGIGTSGQKEGALDSDRYWDRDLSRYHRTLGRAIEDITRKEFGFRKVGEGWVSETLLYQSVCRLMPEFEVIRHFRPKYLNGLELDLYIHELHLGIEYQGQQHFHPVKAWGGERALECQKQRDKLKRELCREVGIRLVVVNYYDSLADESVRNMIFRESSD